MTDRYRAAVLSCGWALLGALPMAAAEPWTMHVFNGAPAPFWKLHVSDAGNTLAAIDFGPAITLWDLPTGTQTTRIPVEGGIRALAISPGGRWLAYSDATTLHLVDVLRGTETARLKTYACPVALLRFAPDESLLAAVSEGRIELWSMADRKETASWVADEGGVLDLEFSPDGSLLASRGREHVRLWNVNTGAAQGVIEETSTLSIGMYFIGDGSTFATDRVATVADGMDRILTFRTLPQLETRAVQVAHLPPGPQVARLETRIPDEKELRPMLRLLARQIEFSPTGNWFVTTNDQVEIWDVETGKLTHALKLKVDTLAGVAVLDESHFALAHVEELLGNAQPEQPLAEGLQPGARLRISFWNAERGEQAGAVTLDHPELAKPHSLGIPREVTLSRQGRVLTSAVGNSARVWNVAQLWKSVQTQP